MAGQPAAYGYLLTDAKYEADLWLLNSCTLKTPAEDHLKNEIDDGRARVPQGQQKANYLQGLSIIGVQQIDRVVEVVEETLKAKDDNRKHAAKVAEEVATLILPAPEYLFDAYEDGRQGDGFLVDFATTEKEAIEENAAHIAGIEADKKKQESQWSKRVTIDNNTWNEFTPRLFGAFVSAEACDAERCDYFKQELTIIIRCLDDCKNHLCPDYIEMRVFVPARCRTEKCKKLGTKGTLVLVAGTKHCTVISEEGRFHLHCASFKCSRCDGVMNAELEDYIGSGYWPGNPKTLGIFFMTLFLKLYFHLKNYLPGSSEYGLLKALGKHHLQCIFESQQDVLLTIMSFILQIGISNSNESYRAEHAPTSVALSILMEITNSSDVTK
ncbi:Uncharacterized protein APZ42_017842 [Daphnia magna]|uniref:MTTase N-terminal domain-containing protein n=1 Tax=Daphnia magna TaxID=35525 RepID=A0A164ZKG6_9CRUS|nr:Uncharacterized protein APZ42_017842 [Daphnia magna]